MILNEQMRLQVKPARSARKFGQFEYAEPLTPELRKVYAEQAAKQQPPGTTGPSGIPPRPVYPFALDPRTMPPRGGGGSSR
jgi:hypothetical protein